MKSGLCEKCHKWATKKSFTVANNAIPYQINNNGKVCLDIPVELSSLTIAEKGLIQLASPLIPIVHLQNGQLGSWGHVCSFQQRIDSTCQDLPCLPEQVCIVKVIWNSIDKDGDELKMFFEHDVLKYYLL